MTTPQQPAGPPASDQPLLAPRRRKMPLGLIAAAAVTVTLVAILAVVFTSASSVTLRGVVTGSTDLSSTNLSSVYGSGFGPGGGSCIGFGGFSDISEGTGVVVYGTDGRIVGTGKLAYGISAGRGTCTFTFEVPNLPAEDFYQVEVSHRGKLTYSLDDVRNGSVQMSLGS